MNIRQILLILRLRWWLVLLILLLVVSGTLAFSLATTKRYLANTSIILDMKTDPLVATLMPALAMTTSGKPSSRRQSWPARAICAKSRTSAP